MTEECLELEFGGTSEITDEDKGFVCFSGGKDSTAMLLRMLELNDPENYPVNRIAFSDTTFEFDELYDYLSFIDCYIQEKFPGAPRVEKLQSKKTWDDWFYGSVTRGANKGKTRGAPLKAYPCWWSREAKILPLQREQGSYGSVYIGIAADEKHRVQKPSAENKNLNLRYPLIEWDWTEDDCMAYLDHLGIGNCLYLSFDRIGCYHCPKQSLNSWFEVWQSFPDKWELSKEWDKESLRVAGRGLRMEITLEELQKKFEDGWRPKEKKQTYECNTCAAVGLYIEGVLGDDDFDSDNAFERDSRFMQSKLSEEFKTPDDFWIPPSQQNPVEWL